MTHAIETDREGSAVSLALGAILLLAAGLRFWGVLHDLPFSYYGDELHLMKRAMAMGTGDLNPHWFHKPALLMYVLAFFYGLYFAAGMLTGHFASSEQFGAHFLFEPGPFLLIGRLVVLAFGVATVYVVYRLGRKAYGYPAAGLVAALVAAVLEPMIDSSQEIKSDVPAGFLIALSVYVYMGTRDSPRLRPLRPLVVASLLAGAAMGMHYYGIVLVPTFVAMEALRAFPPPVRWRAWLGRTALVVGLFLLGFLVTSPYNLLDPTWSRQTFGGVLNKPGRAHTAPAGGRTAAVPQPELRYDPDSQTVYRPGPAASAGAAVAFFRVLTSRESLGLVLTLLAVLGLAATLARRETRWYGLLVLIPFAVFFLAAITIAAYHTQPRHLNAIYPLLATLIWPALETLTRPLRSSPQRTWAAAALAALACLPTLVQSVRHNVEINRLDSRLVSYRWILANIPRGTHLLVDEYGPQLNPDRQATRRLAARLGTLPDGPFIHHQELRIRLLERYPPADGVNLDEFGHQWWLPKEKTDAELHGNETDLDMANPLISREPKDLDDYRGEGVRYVITNSEARGRYRKPRMQQGFPSFARFYRELRGARLIKTFDPAAWGGKGPVVWVYDLAPAAQTADVQGGAE